MRLIISYSTLYLIPNLLSWLSLFMSVSVLVQIFMLNQSYEFVQNIDCTVLNQSYDSSVLLVIQLYTIGITVGCLHLLFRQISNLKNT